MPISFGIASSLSIDQNLTVGGTATVASSLTLSGTTASSLLYGNASKAVSSVTLSSNLSLTTGTLALAAALTGINSITSVAGQNLVLALGTGGTALTLATSTLAATFAGAVTAPSLTAPAGIDLTLAGGSSGASLVLGQGTTAADITFTPKGTGEFKWTGSTFRQTAVSPNSTGYVIPGYATGTNPDAGSSRGVSVDLINLSATNENGTALTFSNSNQLSSAYIFGQNLSHAGRTGNIIFGTANGAAPNERARITSTGNLLLGTTSETGLTGAGGLKIASTTAGASNAGALVVQGGISAAGASYFGGAVTVEKSLNSDLSNFIINTNAGTGAEANLYVSNAGTGATSATLGVMGTGYATVGGFIQDAGVVSSGTGLSGGLSIMARAASSDIRFYAGSHTNLVATFASTGAATFTGAVTAGSTIKAGAGSGETLSAGSVDVAKDIGIASTQGIVQGGVRIVTFTSGAATFAGAVTVNSSITSGTGSLALNGASGNGVVINNSLTGGVNIGAAPSTVGILSVRTVADGIFNFRNAASLGSYTGGAIDMLNDASNTVTNLTFRAAAYNFLTGAATFAGAVTAQGDVSVTRTGGAREVRIATTTSGAAAFYAQGYSSATGITGTAGGELVLYNQDSTANTFGAVTNLDSAGNTTSRIRFINESDANNTGSIAFATRPSGGSLTDALTLASTGAATFAGAVTAGGNVLISNPSSSAFSSFQAENNNGGNATIQIGTSGSARAGTYFGSAEGNLSLIFANGTSSTGLGIGTFNAKPLVLGTNNTAALTINATTQAATFAGAGTFGGRIAINAASVGYAGVYLGGILPNTGGDTNGVGYFQAGTFPASYAVGAHSFYSAPASTASAYTLTNMSGFYAAAPTKGAGSTITNLYGVYVEALTQGTNNYAFRSAGAGVVSIGDTATSSSAITGALQVAGGIGVAGASYFGGALEAGALNLRPLSNSPFTNSAWIRNTANDGVFFANSDASKYAGLKTDGTFATNGNLTVGGSGTSTFAGAVTTAGRLQVGSALTTYIAEVREDAASVTGLRVKNDSTNALAYSQLAINASGNSWGFRMGSSAANSNALEFISDITAPAVRFSMTPAGAATFGGAVQTTNIGLGAAPLSTPKIYAFGGANNEILRAASGADAPSSIILDQTTRLLRFVDGAGPTTRMTLDMTTGAATFAGAVTTGGTLTVGGVADFTGTGSTSNVQGIREGMTLTNIGGSALASKVFFGNGGGITINTGVTTPEVSTLRLAGTAITLAGTGAATKASTLWIAGPTTGATTNYALNIDSGKSLLSDSTSSTGVGTGALQVAGGIYAGAASYFGGAVSVTRSVNTLAGSFVATNSNGGTGAGCVFSASNGTSSGWFGISSIGYTTYGILTADSVGIYTDKSIFIASDNPSGRVKIGVGSSIPAVGDFSATGLAVTGTLSSTGAATFAGNAVVGGGSAAGVSTLTVNYSSATKEPIGIVNTNTGGKSWYVGDGTGTSAGQFAFRNATDSITALVITGAGAGYFAGTVSPQAATTAAAPAYVKGAIYFDTTLNKLRVGGATGWETITSV